MDAQLLSTLRDLFSALNEDEYKTFVDRLQTLGVANREDMSFIESKDLEGVLKPIQVRKLVSYFKDPPVNQVAKIVEMSSSSRSLRDISNLSALSSNQLQSHCTPEIGFFESYCIPVDDIPNQIYTALLEGRTLNSANRCEFIRIVVADLMKSVPRPRKAHLEIVAKNIVKTFRDSLEDRVCGKILGVGYYSFHYQLIARVENSLRQSTVRIRRKKKSQNEASNVDDPDSSRENIDEPSCKRATYDEYGFANYSVPISNSEMESQNKIKDDLKCMFLKKTWDSDTEELMKKAFPLQRAHIIRGESGTKLKENWPFLFEVEGFSVHINKLMGFSVKNSFETNLLEKHSIIHNFFKEIPKKSEKLKDILVEISNSEDHLGNDAVIRGIILLLAETFKEDLKNAFKCCAVTTGLDGLVDIPAHPCLIFFGDTIFTAEEFGICIDGQLLFHKIQNFCTAFYLFFGSFYLLNIPYPESAAITLEFSQRCLMDINPEMDSKIKPIPRKIASLIKSMSLQQWLAVPHGSSRA